MRAPGLPVILAFASFTAGCADTNDATESAAPPAAMAATSAPNDTAAAPPAPECNILMGWDPWEPYQYNDVDGNLRGLDVELVRAITASAGCTVTFVEGRWSALVGQLQKGEVDMLTGASRTPARESFAWFSEPYRAESFTLYVRSDEIDNYAAADIATLMEGAFRLGITEQFSYGEAVTSLQEDPAIAEKFFSATVGELNYARLLDFEIDGFLDDPFAAARAFRMRSLGDQIAAHPIEIHSGDVNLMFSKQSVKQGTIQNINDAIRAMKNDGRHQAIVDKYRN